ncbi:hypothetical protein [Plantactinospora sonchi]|uniref:Fibronectin type-III domain-containing protein n=1 Tax=Plantactinospora sonchi TaxID=1544735 RepID=A0ABU7RY69_9ACTN
MPTPVPVIDDRRRPAVSYGRFVTAVVLAAATVGLVPTVAVAESPGPVGQGTATSTRSDPTIALAPLFADDFEDGDALGWTTSGGQWSIGTDTSRVYRQRGNGAGARARAGDPGWTDYTVSVRVRPTGSWSGRASVGVLARMQSNSDHYYLLLRAEGRLELGKVVNGRPTVLGSVAASATIDTWHPLRLAVHGDDLVGRLGTTSVTATDTRFTRGRIGLVTGHAAGAFDDVLVEPPAPPAPDTQPPSVPGQPQVLAVAPGTATITWPASTDNVAVTQYHVYQGDQFYSQYLARTVPDNTPITLGLDPTAARTHFSVAARDAAGNTSQVSVRVFVPQPPSFPRSGDNTVAPSPPGTPRVTGSAPDGGLVLSWEPATDDEGVREYHVLHTFNLDEVRVVAKVATNSAIIVPRGGHQTVRVVAYDASWNSSSSPSVSLLPPTVPPTPPTVTAPPPGR